MLETWEQKYFNLSAIRSNCCSCLVQRLSSASSQLLHLITLKSPVGQKFSHHNKMACCRSRNGGKMSMVSSPFTVTYNQIQLQNCALSFFKGEKEKVLPTHNLDLGNSVHFPGSYWLKLLQRNRKTRSHTDNTYRKFLKKICKEWSQVDKTEYNENEEWCWSKTGLLVSTSYCIFNHWWSPCIYGLFMWFKLAVISPHPKEYLNTYLNSKYLKISAEVTARADILRCYPHTCTLDQSLHFPFPELERLFFLWLWS